MKKPSARVIPIEGRGLSVSAPPPLAASGAGDYSEEGWEEDEVSAAEIEVDAAELDELESDLDGPELGPEPEDDAEW